LTLAVGERYKKTVSGFLFLQPRFKLVLIKYKSILGVNMTLRQNVSRFLKVGHTSKTSPTQELNQDVARQSGSWRQAIFNRVVTPNKSLSGKQHHERGLRDGIHDIAV
jgi:hypothetical protein